MHELGIVFHIIDILEEVGRENRLKTVSSVTLEIGEVAGIEDPYLFDCWKWAANKSDLLRGSRLKIEQLPAVTLCEECGCTYATVQYGKICPHCQSASTHLLHGNEFSIKEIEAC